MTQLPYLQEEFKQTLTGKNIHSKGTYNKRLYMVKDGNTDQSGLISKLLLPKAKDITEFLDITPAVHAHLSPKLRFFKVLNDSDGLNEIEFKFRNFTSTDRINNLSSPGVFDRGGDYGIKEFSVSYEGTNPATARNDIKANLSMYFQSFEDFIKKRFSYKGSKFGFVDMLLLPTGNKGSKRSSLFDYSPGNYRIRVDFGWNIDSLNVPSLKKILGSRFSQLKNALVKTNKSFYLNMVDHTLDFRDDGSLQINVEYRAYIESTLKGSNLDALSSVEIQEQREKIISDYKKIVSKKKCTVEELTAIRAQLDQTSDLLTRQSFQSIMNRLLMNNSLYFKKLTETSKNRFQKQGFFSQKAKFNVKTGQPTNQQNQTQQSTRGQQLQFDLDSFDESLENGKDFLLINYFYLGDLLYAILDPIYKKKGTGYKSGAEKFKFILGSFQYEDVFSQKQHVINLASIPISAELFFEWFTENVLKPERQTYPIISFIRDLCTFLIGEILSENCFKKSLDKNLQFKTTNFMGLGEKGADPLIPVKGPIIDINANYGGDSVFPLQQDSDKNISIRDFTNYLMIYVDAPKLRVNQDPSYKRGVKSADGNIGIYHYQIGKPHGLLKKLKFSKTDMQYIREARFFRHGVDGLLQLSAVYKVSLDMVGNTLYYPGTWFWRLSSGNRCEVNHRSRQIYNSSRGFV